MSWKLEVGSSPERRLFFSLLLWAFAPPPVPSLSSHASGKQSLGEWPSQGTSCTTEQVDWLAVFCSEGPTAFRIFG